MSWRACISVFDINMLKAACSWSFRWFVHGCHNRNAYAFCQQLGFYLLQDVPNIVPIYWIILLQKRCFLIVIIISHHLDNEAIDRNGVTLSIQCNSSDMANIVKYKLHKLLNNMEPMQQFKQTSKCETCSTTSTWSSEIDRLNSEIDRLSSEIDRLSSFLQRDMVKIKHAVH